MEASLFRAWQERLRCGEELELLATELGRAVAYYRYRVGLLEQALEGVERTSSKGRILSLHLRRKSGMLSRFEILAARQALPDL